MVNTLPRYIKPETADIGDTVRITYEVENGIRHIVEATINRVERWVSSNVIRWVNDKGITFLEYHPTDTRNFKVTLLATNRPVTIEPLFDLPEMQEIRERMV